LNILPVTTLRTIDLEGKKKSDPLFSRFWAQERVFFEGNVAPKYVQMNFRCRLTVEQTCQTFHQHDEIIRSLKGHDVEAAVKALENNWRFAMEVLIRKMGEVCG